MQTKINREFTSIQNASKITSKQVLLWAKLEKVQRTWTIERTNQRSRYSKQAHADILDPATHPKDVQHKTRDVVSVLT